MAFKYDPVVSIILFLCFWSIQHPFLLPKYLNWTPRKYTVRSSWYRGKLVPRLFSLPHSRGKVVTRLVLLSGIQDWAADRSYSRSPAGPDAAPQRKEENAPGWVAVSRRNFPLSCPLRLRFVAISCWVPFTRAIVYSFRAPSVPSPAPLSLRFGLRFVAISCWMPFIRAIFDAFCAPSVPSLVPLGLCREPLAWIRKGPRGEPRLRPPATQAKLICDNFLFNPSDSSRKAFVLVHNKPWSPCFTRAPREPVAAWRELEAEPHWICSQDLGVASRIRARAHERIARGSRGGRGRGERGWAAGRRWVSSAHCLHYNTILLRKGSDNHWCLEKTHTEPVGCASNECGCKTPLHGPSDFTKFW